MTEGRFDRAADMLKSSKTITIACHVNPDGDALGSVLAAALGLKKMGKAVAATWDGGPDVPPGYEFLPGLDLLVSADEAPGSDVFLALDCGAIGRLGSLETHVRDTERTINIDHHPGNDFFATENVVVTEASSTAELVAELLAVLEVELDRDIAVALYTGVYTDTGSFQYANTSKSALRLAADLLDHGVSPAEIAQEVHQTAPFAFLRVAARVLGRARLHKEERFVHSRLLRSDLRDSGVQVEETDKLIDLLRSTRDADVAAMFKEQGDGSFRVSLRSKGVSVGAIARSQGGGGHDLAAGFTTEDVDEALRSILEQLRTQAEG